MLSSCAIFIYCHIKIMLLQGHFWHVLLFYGYLCGGCVYIIVAIHVCECAVVDGDTINAAVVGNAVS